jgi:hypothetical protein
LINIKVTGQIVRRLICRCTRIFHKISSYYAPLQAVIKSFEINYTFSSILILVASIYCKKRPRAEKRDCLFSFWKFFVSLHTKCKIFRSKVQRSNIDQISKYFIFVLFGPNTNFLDPTVLEIWPFQKNQSTLLVTCGLVAGHLVAWSFGREVIWSQGLMVVELCKRTELIVVFASNWRSGNLAFVFIEEVGEWKPLVFAFNSVKRETSFLIYLKKWRTEFTSFCIKLEIRESSFCIHRISWRMESTSLCVIFEGMSK